MPALQNWSPTVVPASYLGRARRVHLKQAYIYSTASVKSLSCPGGLGIKN